MTSRLGGRYEPSMAASVVMVVFVVGVGAFWFALAFTNGENAPLFFPMGAVIVVAGLAISLYQYRKARRYRAAYRAYQGRRGGGSAAEGASVIIRFEKVSWRSWIA